MRHDPANMCSDQKPLTKSACLLNNAHEVSRITNPWDSLAMSMEASRLQCMFSRLHDAVEFDSSRASNHQTLGQSSKLGAVPCDQNKEIMGRA